MIKTIDGYYDKTYIGYSNNLKLRLLKHNTNKGAKSTKGYKWEIIYKKKFLTKHEAMSFEYFLKKNRNMRLSILKQNSNDS
jgi:putative endonuclease